jgi:pilus assembly protein CpaF
MLYLTSLIEGQRTVVPLEDGITFIGRDSGCAIRLDFPDVSERHALLSVSDGKAILKDLNSSNGTLVNGVYIDDEVQLNDSKVIQIGSSMFRISNSDPDDETSGIYTDFSDDESVPEEASEEFDEEDVDKENDDPFRELRRDVQSQVQRELLKRMDMKKLTIQGVDKEGLEENAREKIRQIIDEVVMNGRLPEGIDALRLEEDVFNEAMRLGPLEELLADDSISEIMVNGPSKVYIERSGRIELSDCQFSDDASVLSIIERIVSPIGRRIDESMPYVDARLADGSRVNAIIAPLALSGPTITIRKFSKKAYSTEDFVKFGTWTRNAAEFMKLCVLLRKNIVVAGGTGSGKTTLLNLLSSFIPEDERIITVEDAAELKLQQPHVIRLEARPPNIEGKGAVTIRDLVKNCLRMRPDRIIVGECRSG